MILDDICFLEYKVIKNDFLDLSKSIYSQKDNLYEDMLQIEINGTNNYIIDIGWYGEDFEDGIFKCFLVCDGDWDVPVSVFNSKSMFEMKNILVYYCHYLCRIDDEIGKDCFDETN